MKKFLLSLAAVFGLGLAAQADSVTIDFTKIYPSGSNSVDLTTNTDYNTDDNITLTFGKGGNSNAPQYYYNGTAVRFYVKNTVTVTVAEGYQLDDVVFTMSSSNGTWQSDASANVGNFNTSTNTWTAGASNISSVTITNGNGSSGHTRFTAITVNYSKSGSGPEVPSLTPAGLAFPEESYTATVGESFSAPTLTNPYSLSVTYTSSDTSVATVNSSNGSVTILAAGTTTITATSAETDTYAAGEASYTLTVSNPLSSDVLEVTYDSNAQGYENADDVTSYTAAPIEFTFAKGSNTNNAPKYYTTGSALRCYYGNTITINSQNNANIVKVEFGFGTGDNGNSLSSNVGTWNSPNWTGSATEVVFTIGPNSSGANSGNRRIQTITVYYEGGDEIKVATPVITCTDNKVTITCETDGATIYYTTDGTDPSDASEKYTEAFDITSSVTVKAIAYNGQDKSGIASYNATYVGTYANFEDFAKAGSGAQGTVNGPITVVYQSGSYLYVVDSDKNPMLIFGGNLGTFVNGDQLASVSGTYTVYQGLPEITNPTLGEKSTGTAVEPTTITAAELSSTPLNSYVKFENLEMTSATAASQNGDNVTLYSRFQNIDYPDTYPVTVNLTGFVAIFSGNYQVYPMNIETVVLENQVEQPVFKPAGGSIAMGTEVTIECATPDATIYYTTDGTEPNTSSEKYVNTIVVNSDMTIKAYAVAEGMTDSYVATATYTVYDPNAKEATFNFTEPSSLNPQITPSAGTSTGVNIDNTVFTNNGVNLKVSEKIGNTAARLWTTSNSYEARIYSNDYILISVNENLYHITQIDFTRSTNGGLTASSGSWNNSTGVWTPSGDDDISEVKFTVTTNTYIQTVTVHYADGEGILTGVEAVEAAEEGEAVYYNLQGVRVNNPERGIFVKVQNGKATKVVK